MPKAQENNPQILRPLRNSAPVLLAAAVTSLFPQAQLLGGEVSDIGFYYDFALEIPVDGQLLDIIDQEMRRLISQQTSIRSMQMMRKNAQELLRHKRQPLRADQFSELTDQIIPLLQIGEFADLAPEPHISDIKEIACFKLQSIETSQKGIIRITGTVFPDQYSLKKFLKRCEEAKKCDHRLLGKQLDLFSPQTHAPSGSWLWHPKGFFLRQKLLDWWRKEHEDQHFSLIKSSNESAHAQLFSRSLRSYKELPVAYAEMIEQSTQAPPSRYHGLFISPFQTTDREYIFCRSDQVEQILISSLQFIQRIIRMFGFEHRCHLQNSNVKGRDSRAQKSYQTLVKAAKLSHFDETIESNERLDKDENDLVGPEIVVGFFDALGREWRGPSVGIDLQFAEKHELHYQGADGAMHQPTVIRRSSFGCLERIIALLVEHTAGHFPFWIAPEQVRVIPVSEKNIDYAAEVARQLLQNGLRATVDLRHDSMGSKVHRAENEKIPYIAIVGDREEKNGEVTVRQCQRNEDGAKVPLQKFVEQLQSKNTIEELDSRLESK